MEHDHDPRQEREQVTHRQSAVGDECTTDHEQETELRQAKEVAHGPEYGHEVDELLCKVAEARVLDAKTLDLEVLAREGANHADPGEVLLQAGRHRRFSFVSDCEDLPHTAEEQPGEQEDHGHERYGHDRELPVEPEQHRQQHDQQNDATADLDEVLREEHAQSLHVGAATLHQIAGFHAVVPLRRQMLDVTMHERAQAPDQSLRRLGGCTAAQVMEDPADQGDQDDGRPRQHEVGEEGVFPVTGELREHGNAGGQRALECHVDRVLGDERDEQRQRARDA